MDEIRDIGFVNGILDEYLECRTIRHSWSIEHLGVAGDMLEAADIPHGYRGAMLRILECNRCGMARHDFLTGVSRRPVSLGGLDAFVIFARRYRAPTGYLWKAHGDISRPVNADYNVELFTRGGFRLPGTKPEEETA